MSTPHDRGSILPCVVALLGIFSVVLITVSQTAAHLVHTQRTQTAADALVLAIANERDLTSIVVQHQIDNYTIVRNGERVTVRVVRGGVAAQATATRHRPTLETGP